MAFRVRCPRCSQTAEISEDLLGRAGMCNNCGAMVAIPARLNKVCFACGKDVTNSSHTKDKDSNYLCTDCWEHRKPSEQSLFSSPKIECSICHIQFSQEEAKLAHGQPICRGCAKILMAEQSEEDVIPFLSDAPRESELRPRSYVPVGSNPDDSSHGLVPQAPTIRPSRPTAPQFDPDPSHASAAVAEPAPSFEEMAHLESAAQASFVAMPQWSAVPLARPVIKTSRLPLVLSSFALAGTIALGVFQWSNSRKHPPIEVEKASAPAAVSPSTTQLENETLTRVLILKAQAEVLVEVGKVKEGIGRFDALLALGSESTAASSAIQAEIEKAKSSRDRALKILAAGTTQPATPATAEDKAAPDVKKPKSIFDE